MAKRETLFQVLKRSPWWLSVVIAMGLAGALQVFLPMEFAIASGLPFLVIGIYAAWLQRGVPGEAKTVQILESLRALTREDFAALMEDAFRRDGYAVSRHEGDGADIVGRKGAMTTVVAYKRWKVAQTGVGPLKELREAARALGASGRAYIVGGELSDTARQYAADNGVEIIEGAGLAKLVARSLKERGQ